MRNQKDSLQGKENVQNTEIIAFKYGLLEPLDWSSDCDDELIRMSDLWNKLVEIEESYQLSREAALRRHPLYVKAQEEFTQAKAKLTKILCQEIGGIGSDLSQEDFSKAKPQASTSQENLVKYRKAVALARKEACVQVSAELRFIEEERRRHVKLARQQSGLWWCNYNAVVKSYETARRSVRASNGVLKKKQAQGMRLTNQIQGGATPAELFEASNSQVSIAPMHREAWSHPCRGERRRLQQTKVRATIFVRNGERRNVTWPMVMHRPLPPNCLVKNVIVTKRTVSDKVKWEIIFFCLRPKCVQAVERSSAKMSAVEFGWRRMPDGIRIATMLDTSGAGKIYILPSAIVEGFKFADEIASRRRRIDEEAVAWIASLDFRSAPEGMAGLLGARQAPGGLRRNQLMSLALVWREHAAWHPEEFVKIEAWRRESKRLKIWEVNQRRRVIGRRNQLYQEFSRDICSRSEAVVLGRLNIRSMIEKDSANLQGEFFPRKSHKYRIIVAPSTFLHWIEVAFQKFGKPIYYYNDNLRLRCQSCGSSVFASRAGEMVQVCGKCGHKNDCGLSSCANMLNGASDRIGICGRVD